MNNILPLIVGYMAITRLLAYKTVTTYEVGTVLDFHTVGRGGAVTNLPTRIFTV